MLIRTQGQAPTPAQTNMEQNKQFSIGFSVILYFVISSGCPIGWIEFDGACYLNEETNSLWNDANLRCKEYQAQLTKIAAMDENLYIANSVKEWKYAWIGGSDIVSAPIIEGTWMWTDGSLVEWTNWDTGEPNSFDGDQDCLQIIPTKHGLWDDGRCFIPDKYICELSKDYWLNSLVRGTYFTKRERMFLEVTPFFSSNTASRKECAELCARTPHCQAANVILNGATQKCEMLNRTGKDGIPMKSCESCELIIKHI